MSIPPSVGPTWEWTTYIARNTDGTGVVGLHMKAGSLKYFSLDNLPSPQDQGITDPATGRTFFTRPGGLRGANNGNYRIAYAPSANGGKPKMARFRLSGDHTLDTLQVVTNHLNAGGVEWLYLCNKHGNRLSKGAFTSIA